MAKILKLNAISPLADGILARYDCGEDVKDPAGILVRSAQMAEYEPGESLLAVARAGAGTNNIPSAKYAEKGIVVFNTPGANANAVKELVICELFLGGRKIVDGIDWVKTLKGSGAETGKLVEKGKKNFVGCEIAGKTLGVIGLGAIGIMVANAAVALGMKVIGCDPYLSTHNALMLDPAVEAVADDGEILKRADFITLHVPLNDGTRGMIDDEAIAMCKDGVVIINNARGELADNAAIKSALESGKIARYITDFPADELIGVKGAICVPHLGASTPEAEDNCAVMAARQLKDYLENGNITNSVNYPAVSAARAGKSRICVCHRNIANIIAGLSAAVSARGINIANLLDKSKGDYAYAIIDIDAQTDDELTDALKDVPGVLRVRTV